MKKTPLLIILVACLAAPVAQGQNLLLNGDFNSPISAAGPDSWITWSFGSGSYINHEIITPTPGLMPVLGNYDGSYQMSIGATSTSGGGGIYQTVSATAGLTYTLSVDAGAQNWWLPVGQIRLFFLDVGNNQLGLTQINTTDGIHSPDKYDVGVLYQNWSLNAVAPVGTTQAKVEFAGFGGGSAWFDNAVLTVQSVPEPGSAVLLGAGFGLFAMIQIYRRRSN